MRRPPGLTATAFAVWLAMPATTFAAGGSHVVDDSEVEDPGTCHVETWVTRRSPSTTVGYAAPACTPKSLPWLEIGALASYGPGRRDFTLGPALKATLRAADEDVGIGIDLSSEWHRDTGRFEIASVIVPVTWTVSGTVDVSGNLGWLYTRTGTRSALFTGAQLMWQARERLGVMVEAFHRSDADPGAQAGLRWTPVDAVDLDLTFGHAFDGTNHTNVTLGLIARLGAH